MNFGPLNQDGGERRLNVAVTRARRSVKLISSIMPEDIDLTRTQSLGAKLLRDYMFYTRDGAQTLGVTRVANADAESESPFEEAVYQALTAQGLTLHKQVGVSNYRIDLGVADPDQPGRYLLGIECDGAMYHLAPTARERDRLRQQVLEQLGWKMHRIWSHDWISHQAAEIDKVLVRLKNGGAACASRRCSSQVAPEAHLAETQTWKSQNLPTYVGLTFT
jgi:very-short-patch-repair endonuclease